MQYDFTNPELLGTALQEIRDICSRQDRKARSQCSTTACTQIANTLLQIASPDGMNEFEQMMQKDNETASLLTAAASGAAMMVNSHRQLFCAVRGAAVPLGNISQVGDEKRVRVYRFCLGLQTELKRRKSGGTAA